ncbi:MAG: tetratricopeptide repeat protein [Anaerolineales bacterium]|nr:tetratricopeptide repeat protein [Anaerolineales bacterium]
MSRSPSDLTRWQNVLRRQKQSNARQWLAKLETAEDLSELVEQEYANLLRVLENTIQDEESFEFVFDLIQKLHPFVVGYADWDRWLTYLQQALAQSQKLGHPQQAARLSELVSDIAFLSGDWNQAKGFYGRSLRAYEESGDLKGYVSALARLSAIHAAQGEIEAAINLGVEAISVSDSTGDSAALASAKLTLSQTYYHAREMTQSLALSKEALALGQQLGLSDLVDKALLNIVACEISLALWEEAEKTAKMLESRLNQASGIQRLSQIKNNLGIIAFHRNDYLAAEHAWQEALHLHSQMQYPAEAAGIRNNLGKVYTQLGEWETAEQMLLQAIEVYDSLGDLYQWANTMDNLADLYKAWGKTAVF